MMKKLCGLQDRMYAGPYCFFWKLYFYVLQCRQPKGRAPLDGRWSPSKSHIPLYLRTANPTWIDYIHLSDLTPRRSITYPLPSTYPETSHLRARKPPQSSSRFCGVNTTIQPVTTFTHVCRQSYATTLVAIV